MIDYIVAFLISVIAGVVSNFLFKWPNMAEQR